VINHVNHQIRAPTEAHVCHHGRTADPGQRDHVHVLHVKLPAGDPDLVLQPGDPYMRQLFPHYLVFLMALASAALVAMILVYVFIMPSKMVYSWQQAVRRPQPNYNLLMEVHNELTELRGRDGRDARSEV